MNDEPVLIQADGSPSESSDEREGWTALTPNASKAKDAPTQLKAHQKLIHRPIPISLSLIVLLFTTLLLILSFTVSLVYVHGMFRELKTMANSVRMVTIELGELQESLDRSLAYQLKMEGQMEEMLGMVSDRSLLLAAHQNQIDGQATTSQPKPSVLNCKLLTRMRSFFTRAFEASRRFVALRVLDLVTFLNNKSG